MKKKQDDMVVSHQICLRIWSLPNGSLGVNLNRKLVIQGFERADPCGLKVGQRIVKIDGTSVAEYKDAVRAIKQHKAKYSNNATSLKLVVEDDGLAL